MLSIVPLLGGGGLFETGAGGSAPKHVNQFLREGHLRWDSLGEYLALAVSLEEFGAKQKSDKATLLGQTLSTATQRLLEHRRAPGRKVCAAPLPRRRRERLTRAPIEAGSELPPALAHARPLPAHSPRVAPRALSALPARSTACDERRRARARRGSQVGEIDNRGESFYIALYWAEALKDVDASFAPLAEALAANRVKIIKELSDAQGHTVNIGGYYMPDPALCAEAMRPSKTFNEIIDRGRKVGTCGVQAIKTAGL
jgi:monomeric isocitrate dehydrogenase